MKYSATVKTTPVQLTNAADEIYQLLCSLPDYDFIQQIVFTTKERPNVFNMPKYKFKTRKQTALKRVAVLLAQTKLSIQDPASSPPSHTRINMLSKESQRTSKFSWAQLCSFTNVTLKPFFSHIKQKIGDVEIIFGSDEEKAINKAIHNVFQTPHICFVRNT